MILGFVTTWLIIGLIMALRGKISHLLDNYIKDGWTPIEA